MFRVMLKLNCVATTRFVVKLTSVLNRPMDGVFIMLFPGCLNRILLSIQPRNSSMQSSIH